MMTLFITLLFSVSACVAAQNCESLGGVDGLSEADFCKSCLTAGCGFLGSNDCISDCNMIADVSCWQSRNPADVFSTCEQAMRARADTARCGEQLTCGGCVQTTKSEGTNCRWSDNFGMCMSGCGMMGCGSDICNVVEEEPEPWEPPCAMVGCAPGYELTGEDERGCGGMCQVPQPPPPIMCPQGCASFFDGCNSCKCLKGGAAACTRMFCPGGSKRTPKCTAWAEGWAEEKEEGEKPCLMVDCAPGFTLMGADDSGCGGTCNAHKTCPRGCVNFFDGCNVCECLEGGGTACTEMFCPASKMREPKCMVWAETSLNSDGSSSAVSAGVESDSSVSLTSVAIGAAMAFLSLGLVALVAFVWLRRRSAAADAQVTDVVSDAAAIEMGHVVVGIPLDQKVSQQQLPHELALS